MKALGAFLVLVAITTVTGILTIGEWLTDIARALARLYS